MGSSPYFNPLGAADNAYPSTSPSTPPLQSRKGGALSTIQERIGIFKTPKKQGSGISPSGIRCPGSPPPHLGLRDTLSMGRLTNVDFDTSAGEQDFVTISEDEACPVYYTSEYDADDEAQSSPEKDKDKDITPKSCQSSFWNSVPYYGYFRSRKEIESFTRQFALNGTEPEGVDKDDCVLGVPKDIRDETFLTYCKLSPNEKPKSQTGTRITGEQNRVPEDSSDNIAPTVYKKENRKNNLQIADKRPIYQPPPLVPENSDNLPMVDASEDESATLTEGSQGTMTHDNQEGIEDQIANDDWFIINDYEETEANDCSNAKSKVSERGDPNRRDIKADTQKQKTACGDHDGDDFDLCDKHIHKRQKTEGDQPDCTCTTRPSPYKVHPLYEAKYGGFSFV